MRSGSVAIIGRTNVGKSTFLNAALGVRLAIISPLPQTTRDELLGVLRREESEIAFVDTPGLHRPKTELGRRMNASALGSLKSNDVVVFMTDTAAIARTKPKRSFLPDHDILDADDRRLLQALPAETPTILVINKVDLVKDKSRLLPMLTAFGEAHPFRALIPVSVLDQDGVERVLTEIEAALPEREAQFAEDTLTDRPMTFFAREYIREQVLQRTRSEVPHAVAVTIDRFEHKPKLCLISATIHVEKAGQGSILVGHGGQSIKAIGIGARERLEELIGTQVHLELFVRVSDRWKDAPRKLSELGYDHGGGRALSSLLAGKEDTRPRRAGSVPGRKASKKASGYGARKKAASQRAGTAAGPRGPGAKSFGKKPRAKGASASKPLPSKTNRKG